MHPTFAPRDSIAADREPDYPRRDSAARWADTDSNKVLVTTAVPEQKTAWTKARKDVLHLMREAGYSTLHLPEGLSPAAWLNAILRLDRMVGSGGHIVIEYPFEQRKRAYVLSLFCKLRKARLYALIHDLDSLRHQDSSAERELAILRLFDGLVSHNPVMTQWLRQGGLRGKVVNLNLFDYCGDTDRAWHESSMASPLKVVSAGNLSYPKARYIYDPRLGQLRNVRLSLYGAFFEADRMPPSPVEYKGAFDPDTPALDDSYHFGLVWDGTGVESCEGNYGHYMRYNNPHKLSLYTMLGLPVVVWKEAAIANFVHGRGIGVAIGDLRELGDLSRSVSNFEYVKMAANARRLSHKVRHGDFLNGALRELVR